MEVERFVRGPENGDSAEAPIGEKREITGDPAVLGEALARRAKAAAGGSADVPFGVRGRASGFHFVGGKTDGECSHPAWMKRVANCVWTIDRYQRGSRGCARARISIRTCIFMISSAFRAYAIYVDLCPSSLFTHLSHIQNMPPHSSPGVHFPYFTWLSLSSVYRCIQLSALTRFLGH